MAKHAYWSTTGESSAPCQICGKGITDAEHFAKGAAVNYTRTRRIAAGLCIDCEQPKRTKTLRCLRCGVKEADRQRQRVARKTLGMALALLLFTATVHAQDAFPIQSAAIVNAPNVSAWPQTATITRLTFGNGQTSVDFTKKNGPGRWPDIRPAGWDGDIQYTLWLCLQTPQWTCSAFVEFWNARPASGSPSDPDVPSRYHVNWYYAERWSPLFGHGPIKPGESIGFLVTSGDARDSKGPYGPSERSNIVVVPATDTGDFAFAAQPPPVVVPPPVQPPPVQPPPVQPPPVVVTPPVQIPGDLLEQVRKLVDLETDTNRKVTEIHAEVRTVAQQFGSVMMWISKYVAPAIGAWVLARQMQGDSTQPATGATK